MITITSLAQYFNNLCIKFPKYPIFNDSKNHKDFLSLINEVKLNDRVNRWQREKDVNSIWERIKGYSRQLYEDALSNYYVDGVLVNKVYFRGLSKSTYTNVPGIYRNNLPKNKDENYFFNEMQVRCPSAFQGQKNINKLTYMQHYGCPTRLLDITLNPLVALYFACIHDSDFDGVVHVFGVNNLDISYEQSDKVQMLSKLAEFKKSEQDLILKLSYIYLNKGKFPQNSSGRYIDTIIERFYHSIKRDNGAFERDIVPLDLLKPLFVQVPRDNPRILKQDGAFIMAALDIDDKDSARKINIYSVQQILVPAEYKLILLKELEQVCISQATLFPEVEQVADYLKKN